MVVLTFPLSLRQLSELLLFTSETLPTKWQLTQNRYCQMTRHISSNFGLTLCALTRRILSGLVGREFQKSGIISAYGIHLGRSLSCTRKTHGMMYGSIFYRCVILISSSVCAPSKLRSFSFAEEWRKPRFHTTAQLAIYGPLDAFVHLMIFRALLWLKLTVLLPVSLSATITYWFNNKIKCIRQDKREREIDRVNELFGAINNEADEIFSLNRRQ